VYTTVSGAEWSTMKRHAKRRLTDWSENVVTVQFIVWSSTFGNTAGGAIMLRCLKLNDIALRVHTSELRDITCHVGSHSVTCHPTQVNVPRLTPARKAGARFTYSGGMEGWVDLSARQCTHPQTVTRPSINRDGRRVRIHKPRHSI